MITGDIVARCNSYCFLSKSQSSCNIGLSRVDQISGYCNHIRFCFPQHIQKPLISVTKLCIVQI